MVQGGTDVVRRKFKLLPLVCETLVTWLLPPHGVTSPLCPSPAVLWFRAFLPFPGHANPEVTAGVHSCGLCFECSPPETWPLPVCHLAMKTTATAGVCSPPSSEGWPRDGQLISS